MADVTLPRFVGTLDGTARLALGEEVRPPFERSIRVWDPQSHSASLVHDAGAPYTLPPASELAHALRDIGILDHAARSTERFAAATRSATRFYAHQFHPLARYLDNPERRVLIADEVGLGKTIAAGYILAEEEARSPPRRTLVLCPSRLITKWRSELWRRFGLAYETTDSARLLGLLTEDRPFHAIASIDAARAWSRAELGHLDTSIATLDLVVIDEVHHLVGRQGETIRRRFGRAVSLAARGLVALTATPVLLEPDDLERILTVLSPSTFDEKRAQDAVHDHRVMLEAAATGDSGPLRRVRDPAPLAAIATSPSDGHAWRISVARSSPLHGWMTRTRKADVGLQIPRKITTKWVRLSDETHSAVQGGQHVKTSEHALYADTDALLRQSFAFAHRAQLASSIPATLPLLRHGARGLSRWPAENQGILAGMLGQDQSRQLDAATRARCETLANLGALVGKDAKWGALKQTLDGLQAARSGRKVVVFTQWIPTQRYLIDRAQMLSYPVIGLSGQHSDAAQRATLRRFSETPGPVVLVTTDVLSEGLDLIAADAVVNYDLPFNPQRVEQRIGRVDRIGQKSASIDVVNIVTQDTLEERIHQLLHERLHAFETTVGVAPDILVERDPDEDDAILRTLETRQREMETRARLEVEALRGVDTYLGKDVDGHDSSRCPATALRPAALAELAALISTGRPASPAALLRALITRRVEGPLPTVPVRALLGPQPSPAEIAWIDSVGARGFVLEGPGLDFDAAHPIVDRATRLLPIPQEPTPVHAAVTTTEGPVGTLVTVHADVAIDDETTASALIHVWHATDGTRTLADAEASARFLTAAASSPSPHRPEADALDAAAALARDWAEHEATRALNSAELRLRADYARTKTRLSFTKDPTDAEAVEKELTRVEAAFDRLRKRRNDIVQARTRPICSIAFRRA